MFTERSLIDSLNSSLRQADDRGPNWLQVVDDAIERVKLEDLLDARDRDAKLDAEWLAAQGQIAEAWIQ